ncbi:MAG: glycosyltransferase family 4 protein [Actinomycetota bacterium]
MRVALDCAPLLRPPSSIGRYVRELGRSLEAQGVELVRYAVALRGPAPESLKRLRVPERIAQLSWIRFGKPAIESLVGRVGVVHATNFVLPALDRTPGAVTVHDLSFLRDDGSPGRERLGQLVPWSLDRAAAVICPTRAVADEIAEHYGVDGDRLVVAHEGIAPHFFGAGRLGELALGRMGIPGPFVMALGTTEPRKNLPRLLEAWNELRGDLDGWRLVIAGPQRWGAQLPETEGVLLLGRVPDETLPGLLAAAEIFCFPSRYEGFGLPALEAMAAGTPAVVGDYPAASEVLGDAAVLVDPLSTDSLAEALRMLATDADARKRLAMRGRARALGFTWDRTAGATLAAYRVARGSS